MINKLFQTTVVLILFFNVFSISFAEDDQNLASFIIRNYDTAALPTVGSSEADYTIIEFFDYRCGYCSKQANDFQKLLNNTNNVKIIYMEWPIFGDISDTAAKIALIVWQRYPNLYFEVHNQFMQLGPKMKKVSLIDILNKNELNGEEIFQEAISQKSNDIIEANMKLAKSLGLRGTPASIVNDSIYPGYLQYKTLETLIK
jgi:protein-disulfide isomerase|tara:strand:- start:701 stop:1303 length:603 start_codon:yes stop_codon:yes gene_type:complete